MKRDEAGSPDETEFLFEVDGYVAAEDPRLVAFQEESGITVADIRVIGGYATPFTVRELGASK